jgi:hypothetical protein
MTQILLSKKKINKCSIIIIFFSWVSTVHHLRAEVPIKVLCGAGEQSSQMPAGLCNACYHSIEGIPTTQETAQT